MKKPYSSMDRRQILKGAGAVALGGAVALCAGPLFAKDQDSIVAMLRKADEIEESWKGLTHDIPHDEFRVWNDLHRDILCTVPSTPAGAAAKLRVAFRSFDDGEMTGEPERLALRQVWEYLENRTA